MAYYRKWNGENISKAVVVTKSTQRDGNFNIVSMKIGAPAEPKDDNPYQALFRQKTTVEQRRVRTQVREEHKKTQKDLIAQKDIIEEELDDMRKMLKEWNQLAKKKKEMYHKIIYQAEVKAFRKKWRNKSRLGNKEKQEAVKALNDYSNNNIEAQDSNDYKDCNDQNGSIKMKRTKSYFDYFDKILTINKDAKNKVFLPQLCLGITNRLYEKRAQSQQAIRTVDIEQGDEWLKQKRIDSATRRAQEHYNHTPVQQPNKLHQRSGGQIKSTMMMRKKSSDFGGIRSSPRHKLSSLGAINPRVKANIGIIEQKEEPYKSAKYFKIKF